MVNILIISDSPKAEHIERFLQTTIEVRVDVVADIDQALQDIFAKSPTVVCIQNRISDISADDIARHIKMLLRNGVPSFILMHKGDDSAKPVPGLFEHLLDLTLPETKLAEALGAALKSILGDQWEQARLSSPPKEVTPPETTGTTPNSPQESPGAEENDAFVLVNSLDEFMTDAWDSGEANDAHRDNAPPAAASNLAGASGVAPPKRVPSGQLSVEYGNPARKMPPEHLSPGVATAAAAAVREHSGMAPFIENLELPGSNWKLRAGIALGIVVCAAAWYLLRQKPVAVTAVPLPPPVPTAINKTISNVHPPQGNAVAPSPELPSFVPANGRDIAYAIRNPGWERYAGTGYECRIFRENDRIKAVQVLPGKRLDLEEVLLKKVLTELAGNNHYHVVSRSRDRDYLIERGSVAGKADLVLYTQKSKLRAFVVSLN